LRKINNFEAKIVGTNQKIKAEGKNLGEGILKVDSFLNHQVDTTLISKCGKTLADFFRPYSPGKALTAEISGIAPALMTANFLSIPMIYARKHKPITMAEDIYLTTAPSHTKGAEVALMVAKDFLTGSDRVLILDDFLASGQTIYALARIVKAAGSELVGIGVVIEKVFERGRESLKDLGVPIFSLAKVLSMEDGGIELEDDERSCFGN